MSIEALIRSLRLDSAFMRNVTAWKTLQPQPARLLPLSDDLDPRLADALRLRGIDSLYSHQAACWQAAQRGDSFVVVTPTASGKTLCYTLPIVHALLADPTARALYLFPTKALAQDQLAELHHLDKALHLSSLSTLHSPPLSPAAYDGDTPQRNRPRIRQHARLVLTNPDMLHAGILPYHPQWAAFLANLRYVVVDELHAYRGVFGSHVANVLRRLRRLAAFYGAQPQFLCASATIANPQQLAEQLVEAPVTLVDDDGSPKGERHLVFYNPPLVDPDLGLRRSSLLEAEAIAARLVDHDVQTVVFARSRLSVEVLLTYLRDRLTTGDQPDPHPTAPDTQLSTLHSSLSTLPIRGYRSGYLPEERRAIEAGLRDGSIRAVVATNALELGVNIGGLDAAVLTGFPGTIASAWQQAGRAGRRSAVSLAILVATSGALDQYIILHPDYFFGRSPEHALVNPNNLAILSSHLTCSAFELPFKSGERFGQSGDAGDILTYLAELGDIQRHGDEWFWMGDGQPAHHISLRTASPDRVVIQTIDPPALPHSRTSALPHFRNSAVIGELERSAAPFLLHEGAVYLHDGQRYVVERLDWAQGQAWARREDVDYYTQASTGEQVEIVGVQEQAQEAGVVHAYGPVRVISQTSAYRKVRLHTHETLGYGQIDLPEQVLETEAYWMVFSEELLNPLRSAGQWRSDPNDYGPNWPRQRNAARSRDGYRCTVCGLPESAGRQHDVHHKRAFRSFGYVPGTNQAYLEANQLDNLVTVCRSCHQRIERGQRLRTGLGGLAYVLGSLAPLHLMCDPGDLGVIAEAQSTHGGQPAITIFERIPAGIGFSQGLYELRIELLAAAADLLRRCPCQAGCPACVGPLPETQEGEIDAKRLTIALVEATLEARTDN
jgi:DEAD/DEAH box helicase domain-containing protein